MDSIIKNVILTLEKLDEDYFNSPKRKALYYPKGTYSRTIITLFGEITFKRRAYVEKNRADLNVLIFNKVYMRTHRRSGLLISKFAL